MYRLSVDLPILLSGAQASVVYSGLNMKHSAIEKILRMADHRNVVGVSKVVFRPPE